MHETAMQDRRGNGVGEAGRVGNTIRTRSTWLRALQRRCQCFHTGRGSAKGGGARRDRVQQGEDVRATRLASRKYGLP
eukprot:6775080-Pyramimonas_sp.AAC.1